MIKSGIYCISNNINGHIYIGSTKDFYQREKQHFSMLRHNNHHSKYLQNSYNKYGHDNFTFKIIDRISNKRLLLGIEFRYIAYYKPLYNMTGNNHLLLDNYNLNQCPVCGKNLILANRNIKSFLNDEPLIKVCQDEFCFYSENDIQNYDLKLFKS